MDQDLFEEVQARMRDPIFLQRVSQRMCKSEGLFAAAKQNPAAKQNHGLAGARYRGRCQLQIQASLSAMGQHLKRLLLLFYLWMYARPQVR